MTLWLQAHFSLLMMTIGFAPGFGIKFLNSWMNDDRRHDPYNHGISICDINQNHTQEEDLIPTLSHNHKRLIKETLKTNKISESGINVLMDYIDNIQEKPNPIPSYEKLTLKDKLILSMNLVSDIIPEITRRFTNGKQTNKQNKIIYDDDNVCDEQSHHWWLLLGSTDTIGEYRTTQEILEKSLPSDPLCFTVHCLLEFEVFSDHRRETFTRILCDYVLKSHKQTFQCVNETLQSTGKSEIISWEILLRGSNEESSKLTNAELQTICSDLSINIKQRSSNQSNIVYLQAMSEKYMFPCDGAVYDIWNMRNSEEMNACLNEVIGKDLVVKLHTGGINENMYYRNADNTSIRIAVPESIMHNEAQELIPSPEFKNGYDFMSSCLNSDQSNRNQVLRTMLHEKLSKETKIQNLFLNSDGKVNTIFKSADTLKNLEKEVGFRLLLSKIFDELLCSFKFFPHIILPMVSLTYENTILCYDKNKQSTFVYVYHQHRSITYIFPGLDMKPSIQCDIIMSIELGDKYIRHNIAHGMTPSSSTPSRYKVHMNHTGYMLHGRKRTNKNYKSILPYCSISRVRSFHQSLEQLIKNIKYEYICESSYLSGMISFLEELSSCGKFHKVFSNSVCSVSEVLSYPMFVIAKFLKDTDQGKLSFNVLCPIFCLMFKQSIGVFEYNHLKKRQTYFYTFNHMDGKVHCNVMGEYTVLEDWNSILYLFSSSTTTGYYSPRRGSDLLKMSYLTLLGTKFSYLEEKSFQMSISRISTAHTMNLNPEDGLEEHSFRPHEITAMLHTNVTNTSPNGSTTQELRQRKIKHHALILVFPLHQGIAKWDTCIIHHPDQNIEDIQKKLQSYFTSFDNYTSYNFHHMKGLQCNDCESAFFMIIYMLIGHRSKCHEDFTSSIERLRKEEEISHKAREWVYEIMNKKRDATFIPSWLKQMIS